MHRRSLARLRVAFLACALLAAAGARADFKDPLLTPASPTARLTSAPMTAVVHAGGGRFVAAGWRGLIVVSEDGGRNWKQAAVPVREDLTALAFPTPTHGWAVGNEGIVLETIDGGLHWAKRMDGTSAAQRMVEKYERLAAGKPGDAAIAAALRESRNYQAQAPARPFLDVAFENEQTGYVVGTYNMIFRTTDGGRSWEPIFEKCDNPNAYNIYAVRVVGGEVFLAGELGLALRLDRKKDRFEKMALPYEGTLFTMAGGPSFLVSAGLRGNAFYSGDLGRSWHRVEFTDNQPATFAASAAMDDGSVAMVTLSGDIVLGRGGQPGFRRLHARAPMKYAGIAAAGADTVVVVGLQGIRTESIR